MPARTAPGSSPPPPRRRARTERQPDRNRPARRGRQRHLARNFTKEQLVEELLCDWYAERRALAERALADPDPWHGLVSFVEDVLGTRNSTIGVLLAIHPDWRQLFHALIRDLLTRAQNTGAARADFTPEDVTLVLLGVTGWASPRYGNVTSRWSWMA
jgi:hypothetical protein